MFRGAYDSDFYRSFRNLLHDQVTLQLAPDEQAEAKLGAAWKALIASERAHRSEKPTLPPLTTLQSVALPFV
jgi:anaerobic magnesium-protoporphyrin IX monomethyl ester cyclase